MEKHQTKYLLDTLLSQYNEQLTVHPKMYFELCKSRGVAWNGWFMTELVDDNPNRKVIKHVDGQTGPEALARLLNVDDQSSLGLNLLLDAFDAVREYYHYTRFYFYAKPSEGWVLYFAPHHTPDHMQHEQICLVKGDTPHDVLNNAVIPMLEWINANSNVSLDADDETPVISIPTAISSSTRT